MPDNFPFTPGSGGVGASDGVTTVNGVGIAEAQAQRIKVDSKGVDGAFTDASLTNPFPVEMTKNSLVSTVNSTIANLAANAVFTGTSEDVSEYSDIAVAIFTSHVGATDGLSMQQSSDGTNWDITDVYTVAATTAGNGKVFHMSVSTKFYRLVYTNGATLTTALRIQTIFSKQAKRGSSIRPQDGRSIENDVEEVAAVLMGWSGTQLNMLRSTIANGLAVDVVRGPTLTKATQGTTGFATQDLKDSGRVIFSSSVAIGGITAVATEALLLMVPARDGTASAGTTSMTITAGKRLRLTGISVGFISTAAAVLSGRFVLRMNAAAAVAVNSPAMLIIPIPSGAAAIQAGGSAYIPFPDGLEFSGAMQIGVTQLCSAATGTVWCSLIGFEY